MRQGGVLVGADGEEAGPAQWTQLPQAARLLTQHPLVAPWCSDTPSEPQGAQAGGLQRSGQHQGAGGQQTSALSLVPAVIHAGCKKSDL